MKNIWAGIEYFFGQLEHMFLSAGSHYSISSLLHGADLRDAVFRASAHQARPPHSLAHHRARAVPQAHPRAPLEPGRHRLHVLQRLHVRRGVRLGGAVLSVSLQRHHFRIGRALRPGRAVDAAGLRLARHHHADAVSGLRVGLLVQSLAQPQGAGAVGIPQSAPHRRSAHARSPISASIRSIPGSSPTSSPSRPRPPTAWAIICSATRPISTR